MNVYWHITNRCALNCAFCYMQANRRQYHERPAEIAAFLVGCRQIRSVTITGGEPLLASGLLTYVRQLSASGKHCQLYTSGKTLTTALIRDLASVGIKKLRISCDSPRKEVGGRHMALRKARAIGRTAKRHGMSFEVGTVVIPGVNDHVRDIMEIAAMCSEEGFEYSCSPVFPSCQYAKMHLPRKAFNLLWHLKYRHQYTAELQRQNHQLCHEPCPALNQVMAILPDGTVSPCDNMAGIWVSTTSVLSDSIDKIIENTPGFLKLKHFAPAANEPCRNCDFLRACTGGCRANALFCGDAFGCDPLARQRICHLRSERRGEQKQSAKGS